MKTVRVVAGIIIEDGKVLQRSVDMENLKTDGNFQVERLSKVRHRKKQL